MSSASIPVKDCYLGQRNCPYKKQANDCLDMACECTGCLKEQYEEQRYERQANDGDLISLGNGLALEIVDLTTPEAIEKVKRSCKTCCRKCHGYAFNSINHGVGCYGCSLDPETCEHSRTCFIQGGY